MNVLLALFSYVKANNECGPSLSAVPTRDWTAAQYEEIQLLALSALCTLAPMMIDDYISCHGGTRLLLMLEWCCTNGMTRHDNQLNQLRHLESQFTSTLHSAILFTAPFCSLSS